MDRHTQLPSPVPSSSLVAAASRFADATARCCWLPPPTRCPTSSIGMPLGEATVGSLFPIANHAALFIHGRPLPKRCWQPHLRHLPHTPVTTAPPSRAAHRATIHLHRRSSSSLTESTARSTHVAAIFTLARRRRRRLCHRRLRLHLHPSPPSVSTSPFKLRQPMTIFFTTSPLPMDSATACSPCCRLTTAPSPLPLLFSPAAHLCSPLPLSKKLPTAKEAKAAGHLFLHTHCRRPSPSLPSNWPPKLARCTRRPLLLPPFPSAGQPPLLLLHPNQPELSPSSSSPCPPFTMAVGHPSSFSPEKPMAIFSSLPSKHHHGQTSSLSLSSIAVIVCSASLPLRHSIHHHPWPSGHHPPLCHVSLPSAARPRPSKTQQLSSYGRSSRV